MAQSFRIEFSRPAKDEFDAMRVFDQRRVLDAIEKKLSVGADIETRDRKCLGSAPAAFTYSPPLWELRVGEFRVFYDIELTSGSVYILAVRRKSANKTTAEVLND